MQKEKVLKTGINQAAWCSEQMGFPTPLGHLHSQTAYAARSASGSRGSWPSLGTHLWEYGIGFQTFCSAFSSVQFPSHNLCWLSLGRTWSVLPGQGCYSKHDSQRQKRTIPQQVPSHWMVIGSDNWKLWSNAVSQRCCICFQEKVEWLQTGNSAVFSCQKTFAI